MSKFAAFDFHTIYAVGKTPAEALAKARYISGDLYLLWTARIDDDFARDIERFGWNPNRNSFDVRCGYVVDTTDGED